MSLSLSFFLPLLSRWKINALRELNRNQPFITYRFSAVPFCFSESFALSSARLSSRVPLTTMDLQLSKRGPPRRDYRNQSFSVSCSCDIDDTLSIFNETSLAFLMTTVTCNFSEECREIGSAVCKGEKRRARRTIRVRKQRRGTVKESEWASKMETCYWTVD